MGKPTWKDVESIAMWTCISAAVGGIAYVAWYARDCAERPHPDRTCFMLDLAGSCGTSVASFMFLCLTSAYFTLRRRDREALSKQQRLLSSADPEDHAPASATDEEDASKAKYPAKRISEHAFRACVSILVGACAMIAFVVADCRVPEEGTPTWPCYLTQFAMFAAAGFAIGNAITASCYLFQWHMSQSPAPAQTPAKGSANASDIPSLISVTVLGACVSIIVGIGAWSVFNADCRAADQAPSWRCGLMLFVALIAACLAAACVAIASTPMIRRHVSKAKLCNPKPKRKVVVFIIGEPHSKTVAYEIITHVQEQQRPDVYARRFRGQLGDSCEDIKSLIERWSSDDYGLVQCLSGLNARIGTVADNQMHIDTTEPIEWNVIDAMLDREFGTIGEMRSRLADVVE